MDKLTDPCIATQDEITASKRKNATQLHKRKTKKNQRCEGKFYLFYFMAEFDIFRPTSIENGHAMLPTEASYVLLK